eukprot:TRINITY_DN705_c0_g2_i5.p1 TRINITY_DN705_c0_g2~~TRINITY_DN705_c0_g2_i5.p1  ORF type:complete len:143 (-),score=28.55 TRINITY_DN705_c0_g2_i5:563-991(-)
MKKSLSEPHLPRSPSLDTSDSTESITQTSESSTPHRNRRISSTRQSRIRLDSSGRRVLKGSLEKTLHLPAHYATKTNLTYRSNLESSQPVPEGYSDWEEVAGDDLDLDIIQHMRARKQLEETGKKLLEKGLEEGQGMPVLLI